MREQTIKTISFIKRNIVPILFLIYFVRFAIPQGSYHPFSLAGLFYSLTIIPILGYLAIIGIIGVVELIKSRSKNTPLNSQHKSFILLSLFGLALFSLSMISRYTYLHKEFDADVWNNEMLSLDFDSNLITPRQKMMADLAENILPGLSKSEVESLLGNPDYSWQSEEGGWKIMYLVGPEKGLGVDFQCLQIQFDESDFFQSYEEVHCG